MSTVDSTRIVYTPCEALGWTPQRGPYRAADYLALPEGAPVELIRGELVMSPAPTSRHQMIVLLLADVLLQAMRRAGGFAATGPIDVALSDDTILQPDLVYVAKARRGIVGQRINGAPDLCVEVLSPSNARRDRSHKLALYAEHGVAEVWLADPTAETIEVYALTSQGRYELVPVTGGEFHSPRCPEVVLDSGAFWSEVRRLSIGD